jgi:hypothetical protein
MRCLAYNAAERADMAYIIPSFVLVVSKEILMVLCYNSVTLSIETLQLELNIKAVLKCTGFN